MDTPYVVPEKGTHTGMEIVDTVGFDRVLRVYLHDHPATQDHQANTNGDGEQNLWRAERALGTWHQVRLSRLQILGVVLPWHKAEDGGVELVPPTGLTVGQTVRRLRTHWDDLCAANPVCTAKLRLLALAPMTPLYLSTRALDQRDYAQLTARRGLVHLDGLHRMLAWELAGRLPTTRQLEAYVAGRLGHAPEHPHTPMRRRTTHGENATVRENATGNRPPHRTNPPAAAAPNHPGMP